MSIGKIILAVVIVAVVGFGGYEYWRRSSQRESTEDAQIDAHVHPVSARVSGTATKVLVKNNQTVKAGDLLLEIDPADYKVLVDRARANLLEAQAGLQASRTEVPVVSTQSTSQLSAAEAGVVEGRTGVVTAEEGVSVARARVQSARAHVLDVRASAEKAARDLDRMKRLIAKEEISQQQYDAAVAAASSFNAAVASAEAQVAEAEQNIRVAESQVQQQRARLQQTEAAERGAHTGPQQVTMTKARAESAAARVEQAKAALEQAELNLQYTRVIAPVDGIVSQRSVEPGQVIQTGQPLLAVVAIGDVWVTANFKETQLNTMRPGQPAKISVDAYGGRSYDGHVDSIAAATGARFSMLPAENASGNFVKVVQRIPVKIVVDAGQDAQYMLRPGMSVVATVQTAGPQATPLQTSTVQAK